MTFKLRVCVVALLALLLPSEAYGDELVLLTTLSEPVFDEQGQAAITARYELIFVDKLLQHHHVPIPSALPDDLEPLALDHGSVWLRSRTLVVHYQPSAQRWEDGIWQQRQLPTLSETPGQSAPVTATLVYQAGACGVQMPDAASGLRFVPLPDAFPERGTRCLGKVLHERGHLWVRGAGVLTVRKNGHWLTFSRNAAPIGAPQRHSLGDRGRAWLGGLSLMLSVAGGTFATREPSYWRSALRATSSTVLAVPMAQLTMIAADLRGSRDLGPAVVVPFIILLSPAPALAAWGTGRLTDDHAHNSARGFGVAYAGTLVGSLLSLPAARLLKNSVSNRDLWLSTAITTAVIGFTTSLGYSLGADLPR